MKRKMMALVLTVLFLSACGQSVKTTPEQNHSTQNDVSAQDAASPEEAAYDFTAGDIENNGGWFVRVDNKIYFRKYGPDALYKTAIFGNFLETWDVTGQESEIMSYDLATRRVETVFPDTGCGKLYYGDGGFYLQERINNGNTVIWYSLDGTKSRTVTEGTILGITDSGLLAVEHVGRGGTEFLFYRQGNPSGSFSTADFYQFAGLSEDGLFLMRTDTEGDLFEDGTSIQNLWQVLPDTDEQILCLGTLPETDPMYSADAVQFISAGEKIGVMIAYYAGSGHFLNDFVAVTAIPGVEYSLTALDTDDTWETDEDFMYMDEPPKLTVSESGELVLTEYLAGELETGWLDSEKGDLKLYNGFGWETIKTGFSNIRENGSGYERIVQSMEYLDGAVYVTLAITYASPPDDFGWREAYTLLDMLYLVIPAAQSEEQELAFVDHGTLLQGNVWLAEGESAVFWKPVSSDPYNDYETPFTFLIPAAPDAEWEIAEFPATIPLWDMEEADGYGYPVPDEPGEFLYLRLNRDGEAVFITATSPDALLSIEIGVPETELSDAVETLNLSRRPSDEDVPWYWTRLTALQDGVTVYVERTSDSQSMTEELVSMEGNFVPGSMLLERTLNRGEQIAMRASLPWHPELRVSVRRGGTWGAYVFGEDNYLHPETENGVYPEKILSGYPTEDTDMLEGLWLYRNPGTQEPAAAVTFYTDGSVVSVEAGDNGYWLTWEPEDLYASAWEMSDFLRLSAWNPDTVEALGGMSGAAGGYRVERFRTDGEMLLHLIQANNGDAALEKLLPGAGLDIVLHRYEGAAAAAAPVRNTTLTAEVVKADREQPVIWIQAAEIVDEQENGSPVYRAIPNALCLRCAVHTPELLEIFTGNPYPMKMCSITFDRDGIVTALEAKD